MARPSRRSNQERREQSTEQVLASALKLFVTRGYGGHGILRNLSDGKPILRNNREVLGGCPDHSCAPVLLTTAGISYAVSTSGLYARDLSNGQILWQSRGFAPRACTTPIAANGRLFFSPNVNNTLYCFEPESDQRKTTGGVIR